MFGSQALETSIGLAVMFFIIALGASSILELWSRVLNRRAKDLEQAIGAMLAGRPDGADEKQLKNDLKAALGAFKGTTIYESAMAATGKSVFPRRHTGPSYLSAKSFADAVIEMAVNEKGELKTLSDKGAFPPLLYRRLTAIVREVGSDLTAIKSGLERWFDDTMARVEGSYKRWAMLWLLGLGLVIAVAANASTYTTAKLLWKDPVTRQAVASAATGITKEGKPQDLNSVAATTDALKQVGLPIGWDKASRTAWSKHKAPWHWTSAQWGQVLGWIATGILVMLGAPFWFGLLTSLVSLRSAGSKPPTAPNDPSSATALTSKVVERTGQLPQPAFDPQSALEKALGVTTSGTNGGTNPVPA